MAKIIYYQNPYLKKRPYEYLYNGCNNFLVTPTAEPWLFKEAQDALWKHWNRRDWELVLIEENYRYATVYTRNSVLDYPVWSILDESLESLELKLARNPKKVFIRNFYPAGKHHLERINYHMSKENLEKLRASSELIYDSGAIGIIFGNFRTEIMFGDYYAGLSIAAQMKDTPQMMRKTEFRIMPDGKRYHISAIKTAMNMAAYMWKDLITSQYKPPKRLSVPLIRSILSIQATEAYRENLLQIGSGETYRPADLLPDYLFLDQERSPSQLYMRRRIPSRHMATSRDMITCDTCTLRFMCSLYQKGGVCVLPNSDMKRLADYFGSREVDDVLEGMRAIVRVKADRVEGAVEAEQQINDERERDGKPKIYSDQVTSMMTDLQKEAERVMKIANPGFGRAPLVQINQQNNNAIEPSKPKRHVTEKEWSAAIEKMIEAGVPVENITPGDVQKVVEGRFELVNDDENTVIEGTDAIF